MTVLTLGKCSECCYPPFASGYATFVPFTASVKIIKYYASQGVVDDDVGGLWRATGWGYGLQQAYRFLSEPAPAVTCHLFDQNGNETTFTPPSDGVVLFGHRIAQRYETRHSVTSWYTILDTDPRYPPRYYNDTHLNNNELYDFPTNTELFSTGLQSLADGVFYGHARVSIPLNTQQLKWRFFASTSGGNPTSASYSTTVSVYYDVWNNNGTTTTQLPLTIQNYAR